MKILLVDDMVYARQVLKEILENENIQVEEAETGEQAIEKITKNKFNVVLLDVILGDTNGIELIKQIKNIDSNIRVIMTSGYHDNDKLMKSIGYGAEHYLLKPLDTDKLMDIINNG